MNSNYWNKIYEQKKENEVSWFQLTPIRSLELINSFQLPKDAPIIDIGAGESRLVDHLLDLGYNNLSVLDISSVSLDRMKTRLGTRGEKINYIISNVLEFNPVQKYQLWHDRATFHFLTSLEDVEKYLTIASQAIAKNGFLIISTFSNTGPDKCSGLTISKYSERDLKNLFGRFFETVRSFEDTHVTPWGSKQNFVFCSFKKGENHE